MGVRQCACLRRYTRATPELRTPTSLGFGVWWRGVGMKTATALIIEVGENNRRSCCGRGPQRGPARWRVILDEPVTRVAGRFARAEPRATAGQFVEPQRTPCV